MIKNPENKRYGFIVMKKVATKKSTEDIFFALFSISHFLKKNEKSIFSTFFDFSLFSKSEK